MTDTQTHGLSNTAQGLMTDIERLLGQRLGRFKEDLVRELGKAGAAGTSLGGGLGMAALGTVLGGLGFVHLVHKVTGLPLWLCYAGSSAVACGVGAGLVAEGARKVGDLDLVPEGAGRAARDVASQAAHEAVR